MAGARYRNYFLECQIHSAFNSIKYKTYYSYLEAKGFLPRVNEKTARNSENKELHGNLYIHSPVPQQDRLAKLATSIW